MKVLTIDTGNTKAKLDLWEDSNHLWHKNLEDSDYREIRNVLGCEKPGYCVVCSVRKDPEALISELKDTTDTHLLNFNKISSERYKNNIHYSGILGADRVAAFLGAEQIFPKTAKLIVDCGTAITIDVVSAKGSFEGGNISLGLYSRMKALADYTSLLPLVETLEIKTFFGENTVGAIATGALNGVVGEIIYDYQLALKNFGIQKVVLTGGDSEILVPILKENGITVEYDPYLVARGIKMILPSAQ